jgi:NSS family neurotransmitter:Na+ symporter
MIALMAGFIIFPAASSAGYHLAPKDVGASLLFITLPNVFQQAFAGLSFIGYIFSTAFYLLVILAALTSMISLHEVVTSYMSEEFHWTRKRAALTETIVCILLGCICSLSFGVLNDVRLFDMTIFDLFDWVSSNIFLPIGGMFISLFAGWYLDKQIFRDEITNYGLSSAPYFKAMIFLLRYIVPLAILGIIVNQLGIVNLF